MAGSNSYSSMLSLLQLMLKQNEEQEKRNREDRERQEQKKQSQGQDQQSSPMDAYNQYNQVMDMMTPAAAAPTSIAPAGSGAGGLYGTSATMAQPAGTGLYGTTSTLSAPAGEGLFGTGVGSTAPEIGSGVAEAGGGSIGSYASYIVPILAAIAGQHLMSSNTDRRTMEGGESGTQAGKGHRTGDVFSGDFFTEPWMAWGEQQLGVDTPTAGEKTDAAIDRVREGKGGFSDFMSTVPETAYQWFDPVGNFAGDIMGDKFGTVGKIATAALLPHTGLKNVASWLGKLF